MPEKYIFLDSYNLGKAPNTAIYIAEAYSEEEAWEQFAKFAKGNFGLKSSDPAYVRDYFGDTITLINSKRVMTLNRR